jgi:protein-S-isoprenylcysteine O-methyltransferase Ste14
MSLSHTQKRNRLGSVLVALQFALLLLLAALAAPNVLRGAVPMGTLIGAGVSIAVAFWTLMHNRLGNFNIHPTPKAWGTLVTTGPYRWIRHPMYTSVLIGAAALASISDPLQGWAAWAALAIVLLVKSIFEERWMREQHFGYARYSRESKRFVPWVF